MRRQITRVARLLKRVVTYPVNRSLSLVYAPRQVLTEGYSEYVNIRRVRIGENWYQIAKIHRGRLFTDRVANISVISQRSLVPFVSWQYLDGKSLDDAANFSLQKKTLIHCPPLQVNGRVVSLLTGGGGNYNYYHWLFDCLPRVQIAEVVFGRGESTNYLIPEDTHSFQRETLDALGISDALRISSKECQHLQATELVATSHPRPNPPRIPGWIIKFLRESFLSPSHHQIETPFVYISRGDSVNSRRLLNEDFLCKALEQAGFLTYRLSELAFSDQVSLFSRAKMIVGVHGAGLANLAFASKGAVVYEIFSEQ